MASAPPRPHGEALPPGQVPPRRKGRPPRKAPETVEICVICEKEIKSDRICAGPDAIRDLISASEQRGDGRKHEFEQFLNQSEAVVHGTCRRIYTKRKSSGDVRGGNAQAAVGVAPAPAAPTRRSAEHGVFDEKNDCFICGDPTNLEDTKKLSMDRRKKRKVVCVQTLIAEDTFRQRIATRGDTWGSEVKARLDTITCADLLAAGAKYHKSCGEKFLAGRSRSTESTPGRPVGSRDATKDEAFRNICEYMDKQQEEKDRCQFSMDELEEVGLSASSVQNVYSRPRLREKLKERYGNSIHITEGCGRNNQSAVVNLTGFVNKILQDKWYSEKNKNEEAERLRIVKIASQFILEDMRKKNCNLDFYRATPSEDTSCSDVPQSLNILLKTLITSRKESQIEDVKKKLDRKRNVLGQAIMYAARPNSYIPHTLLDSAVDLHTTFGCRDQIDKFHRFGLLVGYNEVKRFEFSKSFFVRQEERRKEAEAERRKEAEKRGEPCEPPRSFTQYIFDNFDHDTATLGGHGTLHVLGGVRVTTPAPAVEDGLIPRLALPSSALQIARELDYSLDINWYKEDVTKNGLKSVLVKAMESSALSAHPPASVDAALTLDALWMTGRWNDALLAPSWLGYMKSAMAPPGGAQHQRSLVEPLPFIRLPASNWSALHTALHFAAEDADTRGQKECFVTLDQALYSKAVQIVASGCCKGELKGVVVRLGGFHMIMSFLGAIGHIMAGSGLDVLWEEVFAGNSVKHMLTGKAYSRAVRAHFLTQEALGGLLLDSIDMDSTKRDALRQLHEDFLNNKVSAEEVSAGDGAAAEAARGVWTSLKEAGEEAARSSRTAGLWWQYFYLVALLRLFIRAERQGDWSLHKECVKAMLPYFHATGHIHYAKSAHLYVQQMEELSGRCKEAAEEGLFTVRRTDDFWGGVWTDMVIEQDYMCALKVKGGITMRGVTESTAAQWILSRRLLLDVCAAVEKASGVHSYSSEQHVDLRPSRQEADSAALNRFKEWLKMHDPFQPRDDIQCLDTGELGSARKVNCDRAGEIGAKLMSAGYGNNFADLKCTTKDNVIPLSRPAPPAKGKEKKDVDTHFLFMKMVLLKITREDLKRYLTYELAPMPPALFDKGLMRHNNKAALTAKFRPEVDEDEENDILFEVPDVDAPAGTSLPTQYVVDGGHLLHTVAWPRPEEKGRKVTYRDVCSRYVEHVTKNYGSEPTVVFDGYGVSWSTKLEEQKRRSTARKFCPDFSVEENNVVPSGHPREDFLANKENKSSLISLLKYFLQAKGVRVFQAKADADVMVADKALELDRLGQRNVTVIARDTDIVAILVARAGSDTGLTVARPGKDAFNIRAIRRHLGPKNMLDCVLVGHAFSGCDTTSAIFKKGKTKLWTNLEESGALRLQAGLFNDPTASRESIAEAGEQLFLSLYCGGVQKHGCRRLDDLREEDYYTKISGSSKSKVPNLALMPPTSDAAHQHSFRVYMQVQQWLGNELTPTEWGWRLGFMTLEPIPTTREVAPAELLQKMSCNCAPTGCNTRRCPCRKRGDDCSLACGKCKGRTCHNNPEGAHDDWDDMFG